VFDESGLLEKFSGNVAPPLPILSSGPRMRIVFRSDDSVNQDGFAATLTMVGAGTWSPTRVPTRDPTRSPTRLPRCSPASRLSTMLPDAWFGGACNIRAKRVYAVFPGSKFKKKGQTAKPGKASGRVLGSQVSI
jgi:hypothetical protein